MLGRAMEYAAGITERIGEQPTVADETAARTVLAGVRDISRSLAVAAGKTLTNEVWAGFSGSDRFGLSSGYRNLEATAEAVRAEARIMPPSIPYYTGSEQGQMVGAANRALYVADTLWQGYDSLPDTVHPGSVALMGLAAVRAVNAWQPQQLHLEDLELCFGCG